MEWQPIDTAPRDETRILVTGDDEVATSEFVNGRFILAPRCWYGDSDRGGLADLDFEPSHWMPLPSPPSGP